MEIRCVWEHNGDDSIVYAENCPGAFTRGETLEAALRKMPGEIRSYLDWLGAEAADAPTPVVVQEKRSGLNIRDADSDVLFDAERRPLTLAEYESLKALALKSAADFHTLYAAIPDREKSCLTARPTFYGAAPRTAEEMYRHTRNVNGYYFGEIDVDADNDGSILACRVRGFELLECQPEYLTRAACEGSYGEEWSLRKVLRRFIWHDRIHARAMWRMAVHTFGAGSVPNVFRFGR